MSARYKIVISTLFLLITATASADTTNEKIDAVFRKSKDYTDIQITKKVMETRQNLMIETVKLLGTTTQVLTNDIEHASSESVTASNNYTDKKIKTINTDIARSKADALSESNTYTDNKVSNIHTTIKHSEKQAVSSARQYTDTRFNELETSMNGRLHSVEQQVNKNADRANAGIASVAAMTNIPYTDNTRFSVGLGAGNYRNGNAVAFGGQLRLENNVNLRSSVSWNSEDSAVYGAGVAFGF
ncbi:TPA: YadA-like family protein [Morganella morganii]|nr:YadA-like family protein [Morganella morganii]